MARILRFGIVLVWLVLVGILVRRHWPVGTTEPVPTAPMTIRSGEDWMSVYHQDRKIGYVHQQSTPIDGGHEFEQTALLRLVVMESQQTVRTIITGQTGVDYALEHFTFELSSGVGSLRVRGQVSDDTLHLTLATNADESTQRLPLSGPVYLPATLRTFFAAGDFYEGRQLNVQVFDPTAMRNATMQVTVEQREPVPQGRAGQHAWRVREEYRGIRTTAWIDDDGKVVREEGPMGLTIVRTNREEAIHDGWDQGASLDLVQTIAVPVAREITHPRELVALRVRLRGIDLDLVPSDARQRREGNTWIINRVDLPTVTSYPLPYTAVEHRAELEPTPLLQVDHPRVKEASREAIGGETDALRAVNRLLAWIGGRMHQTPTVSIPNALQVLDEQSGDCNEHAVLFAALARAAGLPTRVAAGVVYQEGAFYYHAWNEVWLGKWVAVDPVLGQFPADATHLKFIEGGPEEHFAILHVIGRLEIEVLETSS